MKFVPKEVKGEHNISKEKPLKSFIKYTIGTLILLIGIYIILGFFVDMAAPYVSVSFEKKLGGALSIMYDDSEQDGQEKSLQTLLDSLTTEIDDGREYKVYVEENNVINAFAVPGGSIVVYQGLLDAVESRTELVFVLGHELGHFHNHHHIKGLGRGLVMAVLMAALFGDDSGVTSFFSPSMSTLERTYSRNQELEADQFGLEILSKYGGNKSAAESFMRKMAAQTTDNIILNYLSTHPHPHDRIDALNK